MNARPLIGCATYRKVAGRRPPIEVYGLMPDYSEAVRLAGGLPLLIPLGLQQDDLQALLPRLDGILIPGGGDVEPARYGADNGHPTIRDVDGQRDRAELLLIEHALQQGTPFFAICRGLQVFNVALGGTLWADVQSQMPGALRHDYVNDGSRQRLAHQVTVRAESQLGRVLGAETIEVNSLHHQGIRRLAPGLRAVATAPDGLIEAVEAPDHPFAVAVQWHPENLLQAEPRMRRLFERFVAVAGGDA
ncbi:MAG TPA: gamma-glutamyl-gamma-aminobutyrate hydrolase family protein [Candidatus Sulfomarinibacteraceae bacterium]|nr:gamma-glutamyl-gamma-aminobutyrate hydrolase family protein [Candidatus Sulfomarinibacteraceae bacterium]